MRRYKKNQKLEIAWLDIIHDSGWVSEVNAGKRPNCDCLTIGYYLRHDKELLYISSTISNFNDRDKITIPLGCIKKVVVLDVKEIAERTKTLGKT